MAASGNRLERCPLCAALAQGRVLDHLKLEHRRTESEARQLLERHAEGTLGWDPETRKSRAALRQLSSA